MITKLQTQNRTTKSLNDNFKNALRTHQQGNLQLASQIYQSILLQDPKHPDALGYFGILNYQQEHFDTAHNNLNQALLLTKKNPDFFYYKGLILQSKASFKEAIPCFLQTSKLNPKAISAFLQLGISYAKLEQFDKALAAFQKAHSLKPEDPVILFNIGKTYADQNKHGQAISYFHLALAHDRDYIKAYFHKGKSHAAKKEFGDAISAYHQVLVRQPDHASALQALGWALSVTCLWNERKRIIEKLSQFYQASVNENKFFEMSSLSAQAYSWPADRHHYITKCHSDSIIQFVEKDKQNCNFTFEKKQKEKLRIGYLSADFREHTVGHLIQDLLGVHDREKFIIHAYSFGPDDKKKCRENIRKNCDKFIDISKLSTIESAKRIYKDQVDILVDLTGYTQMHRVEICALKPAPIQVNYLGFLGTIGGDFMDYILSDKMAMPVGSDAHYSEKICYLPNSHQVSYAQTKHEATEAGVTVTRADHNLPDDAFVFCCFNNYYKIDEAVFSTWMKVLKAVPNSVLWLLSEDKEGQWQLMQSAYEAGIEDYRLIFADVVDHEIHTARVQLADMYLDTSLVSARTSADDALWAGVPLLTCPGNLFCNRIGASVLNAIEVPELICESLEDYQEKAIRLATHPEELKAIRKKLLENRDTTALFDTKRFTKNLEKAYRMMWENYLENDGPVSFVVEE